MKSKLYIIGNGFDIQHNMKTRYIDFKQWLMKSNRFDLIIEMSKLFPAKFNNNLLLWCNFEEALGEYDMNVVYNWGMKDLLISVDNHKTNNNKCLPSVLEISIADLVTDCFTNWTKAINNASFSNNIKAVYNLSPNDLYLTFNYTDTLENVYKIPENRVFHIHGRVSKGEKPIFGHAKQIDPMNTTYERKNKIWYSDEWIQNMTDVDYHLHKPIEIIIHKHNAYFESLNTEVGSLEIIGHSCDKIDYPYFKKIKESISNDCLWIFNPYNIDDIKRTESMINNLNLQNYKIERREK